VRYNGDEHGIVVLSRLVQIERTTTTDEYLKNHTIIGNDVLYY